MSLLNDASLVMIPSGYKDTKLYSVKPTNGDGDFTFSRGSNLAATRVNSEGLIEKGRENLLLQSNAFDTTWTLSSQMLTPVGGQSGYDGSSDAWKIQRSDANGRFIKQNISQSGVQTFSVYAKKGNVDYISLVSVGANVTRAIFSLPTDGSGTNTYLDSDNISAKITHISNGWYRVEAVYSDTITDIRIYPSETSTAENGVITDAFIYIQDAQLEQGLVATDYIETTTTTEQAGILEDMPRLDYSGGASCPSLLLEPQRSNLMVQSEAFSTSDWVDTATNVNVTANATISPEGVQNASEIEFTNTGASIFDQFTNVASSMHIGTIFLKNKDVNTLVFEVIGGAPSIEARVTVDLVNGTLSNATGDFTPTIEDFGNGWYRVAIGDTGTATIATPSFKLESVGGNTGSFYAYGAMVEAGSYPTSYIPTYGSSVTRSADTCELLSMSNDITSGISSATLLIEYEHTLESLNDAFCFGQNDFFYPSGRGYIYNKGNGFADSFGGGGFSIPQGANTKTIYRLNTLSNANIFQNGVKGSTVTGTAWSQIDQITFRGAFARMKVKQITLFNEALTDAECIELTTL